MMATFTCAVCHRTFESAWSDEEAEAEYAKNMPNAVARDEETESICDYCYPPMMQWAREQGLEP